MNILVAINKAYKKQLNILLYSIQYSNPNEKFDVYILHNSLDKYDIDLISNGLDLNRFELKPLKIDDEEINTFPVFEKRYPVEIYFRIFASKYLPKKIDRILYLDADTVVINKLQDLYNMDFEGNYFIAATHIKKILHKINEIRLNIKEEEPYINTGVLLINLKELRKADVRSDVMQFVKNNSKKLILPDQDIIVSIYGSKIKLVDDLKYNLGERTLNLYNLNNPQEPIGLKWICKNTVIIHYYGHNKPWNKQYIGKLNCFYKKFEKRMKLKDKRKVLILSSGTGGGHNSAAKAIKEDLTDKGIKADFIEYLDIINPKLRNKINNLYLGSTKKNGKIFKVVYKLGEMYQKTSFKSPVYALNSLNRKKLYKYIVDNGYKYIIVTHLFAAQALTAIKKEHTIKFMEVATDYVCVPFWEETNPDCFVIPSTELKKDFESKGIDTKKLMPLGIPTAKTYREKYNKQQCKKDLNFKIDKKYVLILTGSMGFGNVADVVKKLEEEIKDAFFIVSCGHNTKLLNTLKKQYKESDRVIALPFTNNISKYMKASDIILSKPGGLTTTEIATLKKPFIHTMPIPGCENYNAEFFSKRKMGIKCNTIEEIVKNTKTLLNDEILQEEMINNQRKYINIDTCDKISSIVMREIEGESEKCFRNN